MRHYIPCLVSVLGLACAMAAAPALATPVSERAMASPLLPGFDAGDALWSPLPLRALPRETTEAAYSPEPFHWGWVDDGRICLQPAGERRADLIERREKTRRAVGDLPARGFAAIEVPRDPWARGAPLPRIATDSPWFDPVPAAGSVLGAELVPAAVPLPAAGASLAMGLIATAVAGWRRRR